MKGSLCDGMKRDFHILIDSVLLFDSGWIDLFFGYFLLLLMSILIMENVIFLLYFSGKELYRLD